MHLYKSMRGTDRADQTRVAPSTVGVRKKWWWSIFTGLIDSAAVNGGFCIVKIATGACLFGIPPHFGHITHSLRHRLHFKVQHWLAMCLQVAG